MIGANSDCLIWSVKTKTEDVKISKCAFLLASFSVKKKHKTV